MRLIMARLIFTTYIVYHNIYRNDLLLYLVLGRTTGVMGTAAAPVVVADRLTLDEVSASFVNCYNF